MADGALGVAGGTVSGPLSPVLARGAQPGNGNHGLSSCEYLEDPGGLDFDALIVSPWAYQGAREHHGPQVWLSEYLPGIPLVPGSAAMAVQKHPPPDNGNGGCRLSAGFTVSPVTGRVDTHG